jgi:hypothetical protein
VDKSAPKRRAAGWREQGQKIVCGAGQSHYSTGTQLCFTDGNFFSRFVGESNTFLPDMHASKIIFRIKRLKSGNSGLSAAISLRQNDDSAAPSALT